MIGYVSGHVKARCKISMVQRRSPSGLSPRACRAGIGLPRGAADACIQPPRSTNLDGPRVQSMARCLATLYHSGRHSSRLDLGSRTMSALSDDGVTEKLVHAQTVAAARGLSLTLLRCQVYALIAAS